jgi:outer membrane protein OmpA-like peptidoglycan-associated protein
VLRNRTGHNWKLRGPHYALAAAALCLVACAATPTSTGKTTTAASSEKPASRPAHAAPVAGTVVLDPLSYEQDKDRIKRSLANNRRDSLSPSQVGYYMDVLQGRLKQLGGQFMTIVRHDDRIVLALSLNFEPGSSRIDSDTHLFLTPLSAVLVEYRMTFVSVHIGNDDANPTAGGAPLMDERAKAVTQYLIKAGVAGKRVVIVGSGANRPPLVSLEKSTRIELQIEPIVRGDER